MEGKESGEPRKLVPIYLDDFASYQFEEICAKILSKLRFGTTELTKKSGDEGKDVIIRNGNGRILAECKKFPDTPVGRPMMQKLHSAVISEAR